MQRRRVHRSLGESPSSRTAPLERGLLALRLPQQVMPGAV